MSQYQVWKQRDASFGLQAKCGNLPKAWHLSGRYLKNDGMAL